MMHTAAVVALDAVEDRDVVHDAGGQQQRAALEPLLGSPAALRRTRNPPGAASASVASASRRLTLS